MANCNLCPETPRDHGILDHIRVMHPDQWEEPEKWPDGGLVFIDRADATADEIGAGN